MACAVGAEAFMVTIFPFRSTRVAGWAKAAAETAVQSRNGDTRIQSRIAPDAGARLRVRRAGVWDQAGGRRIRGIHRGTRAAYCR